MKWLEWTGAAFAELDAPSDLPVTLPNDMDVRAAYSTLKDQVIIVLSFPAFRDGRAYSQAARLRKLGFRGHICATGRLGIDQLGHAVRCGFTLFGVENMPPADVATMAVARFGHFYQRAHVGAPVWEFRQ